MFGLLHLPGVFDGLPDRFRGALQPEFGGGAGDGLDKSFGHSPGWAAATIQDIADGCRVNPGLSGYVDLFCSHGLKIFISKIICQA